MLITFRSKVGDITMFGDVAVSLLKMAGHSGTVPGAILGKDIPAALAKLKHALNALPAEAQPDDRSDEEQDAPPIDLRKRAWPLVEQLERAARNEADVTWDRS
ncbi:MAG: DUF1840 domain-containing protein [Burkholderiales bacterium]|nr:DUF1840 domain-containing protein [Burkholderiales bacterium]